MRDTIQSLLLAANGSFAAWILVKATVIAVAGLAAARLARRASVRHAWLAAVFAALLILPVSVALGPELRVRLTTPRAPRATARTAAGSTILPPGTRVAPVRGGADVLLWVWLAGALLAFAPIAVGMWQVSRLRRTALPWAEAPRSGILLHESIPGPMTCGLVQSAIVLPMEARQWSGDDLDRALVHEFEHVERRDYLVHCLARAMCAVYWFHPLVWMAWRQLVLEAERACDDAVLARSEATAYAGQLVSIAQRLSISAKSPMLAMANRADLSTRIRSVLDERRPRGRAGAARIAIAAAAALAVLGISPVRIVAAPQSDGQPLPNLRSRSALVMVDLVASDANGRSIPNLTRADFILTENGSPQNIAVFEWTPLAGSTEGVRDYYALGYYAAPAREREFRKIDVRLRNVPDAKLEFRAGYYPGVDQPPAGGSGPGRGAAQPPAYTTPPRLLFKKEPEYTDEARKVKYQGVVALALVVTESGAAKDLRVVRALGLGLDEKAIEAVKQWRFKPAQLDGRPVSAPIQVEVEFRLW